MRNLSATHSSLVSIRANDTGLPAREVVIGPRFVPIRSDSSTGCSGTAAFETGSFYGGDKQTASFSGRAEITIPFAVEPTVSLNWIELPLTKLVTTLVSTRTTYAFTPRMFVSALVQYSSATTSLSANLRFRWEYLPGSELFVVYTEGRDTFPVPRIDLENRGFVVKINRLFRF
jgi:hypothetical protein